MSLSDEARAGYERALLAATVRHGYVVRPPGEGSTYQQYDYSVRHADGCVVVSGRADEDTWYEFQGTLADDHSVHGVSATGVTCSCGALRDRSIRWRASVTEMIEAVFEEAFRAEPPAAT